MTRSIRRASLLLASLALPFALAACGDDEDDAATGDSSTSEASTTSSAPETTAPPTAPTTASTAPPTSAPECAASIPEPASAESSATGDVDGDGQDDTLEVVHDAEGGWWLRVTLGSGDVTALALTTDNVGGAEMIGAADVDGDGKEELFAQTGAGASTATIGLFTLDGCAIAPITFDGAPTQFPVGASVGATSGLQCSNDPEAPASIFAYAGASSDGESYDVTWAELELEGTVLTQVNEGSGTAGYGDELYVAASTFHCDDVTYGA
jgi:hypothetical protein